MTGNYMRVIACALFCLLGIQQSAWAAGDEFRRRQEHNESQWNLKLPEFYGVKFGVHSGVSTNGLRKGEAKDDSGYVVGVYWEGVDESLRPADFFDFARIRYSYGTIAPEAALFCGHFPGNLTLAECMRKLDDLASDINAKYGVELAPNDARQDVAPSDRRFTGEAPADKAKDEERHLFLEGTVVYCRRFQNRHVSILMEAGENRYGELCARLFVEDRLHSKW